jgi:hypothetical protein
MKWSKLTTAIAHQEGYFSIRTLILNVGVAVAHCASAAKSSQAQRGGLHGSAELLLKVHVQEPTKLSSLKGVDSNGTPPCLGSD